ncbi:hypothetical protein [Mycobacteroides abscessus]|uniref:hypothetical protein n=1 Tax=Mycobacteroides abscessus TaxID=36809 RepID=UPI0013000980|nr:hypothetical protein [Mycobacteroides abscessus]
MSELCFVEDPNSDDYLVEGGDGEYYRSHSEGEYVSAAWTCNENGLEQLLKVFESVVGPTNVTIEANLPNRKSADGKVEVSELTQFLKSYGDEFTSITLRVPDRLFFWSKHTVSSESFNTRLGEIAFIAKNFNSSILESVVRETASFVMGRNAIQLVSYRDRG